MSKAAHRVGNIVKRKADGRLYTVDHVVWAPAERETTYACYLLSAYDGMPIGELVLIRPEELEETR